MSQTDIYITEKTGGREIRIPWIPDEIKFSSKGTRFASYEILDKGEVRVPTGSNVHGYSWQSVLPGEGNRANPLQRGDWQDPKSIQEIWSVWREYGTQLRLLVTGTPINHDVYLEDYDVTYAGPSGDYNYTISFVDARDLTISPSAPPESPSSPEPTRPETQSATSSYTVKSGDKLWDIAQKYLGGGSRWSEIYTLNQDILESTAKSHGKKSSENGHWIFPGTTLQIKK